MNVVNEAETGALAIALTDMRPRVKHQKQGSISDDVCVGNYHIQVFDGTRLQQRLDPPLPERRACV
jgi:hypothetical protein